MFHVQKFRRAFIRPPCVAIVAVVSLALAAAPVRGQTIIGPNPPIETADGVNWFMGSGGSASLSVTDTSFTYNSEPYDGVLSNSAASGTSSGNNADFRAGAFALNGAKTVSISFYYYAASVKSGDNVRVDLRMYQGANDLGFINDNNQHPFQTGTMSGYAFYNSGAIAVPANATYADIRVSINTFGDDNWSSGVAHFDNFSVVTLTGPPFITEQPYSATVETGTAFTNSIAAAGPGTLTYQWYENGRPVTDDLNNGTNATLIINSAQAGDNSTNYYVVVSNHYGAVTSSVVSLTVNSNLVAPPNESGITWSSSHYLPGFAAPADRIDCVDMDLLPADEQAMISSLEGIVNRTRPSIASVSAASEGEFTWLQIHNLDYGTISATNALLKYATNITGLVVYDDNELDTLNLATTIAGLKDELICDAPLLNMLTNPPYNFPIVDDLRGRFTSGDQVYSYLYSTYWPQCTHRILAGLETNNYWQLRDYLVAVKSAVVWLDPGSVTADANLMNQFVSGIAPLSAVYLGWWPNEGADMTWIASYGIPVIASDYFDNGSIYSGVETPISVPPIPSLPPLQNKVYVSFTLSEGDNAQYMQHAMYQNWQSTARGTIPLGWTVQPLLADLDPGMLNYYWSTATSNDCLVAGPSGAGYAHIENWSAANVVNYTKAADLYLQRSGVRTITVWDTVSSATANAYATNCPTLVGVSDEDDGYYETHYGSLPVLGLPANGNYQSTASSLTTAISNTAASWTGTAPMFIPVQGIAWDVTPAECQAAAESLNSSKYVVVRPDQLFLLYQQAVGVGIGGARPIVASSPASQLASVGDSVTFLVTASGTPSLNYQWLKNGTNIPGANADSFTISSAQLSDAGNYSVVVNNNYGTAISSAAALTFGNQPLTFDETGLDWNDSDNGYYVYSPPVFNGNVLELTDGGGGETRAVFFDDPQYIGAFTASFVYQAGGNNAADGIAFCLQNDPRDISALGGGGGSLGVGSGSAILPSLELEFNLYTGNNEKVGYLIETNGLTGANGGNGNYLTPGNVQINSGDPIGITLNYANAQLALTMTDTVVHTSFATNQFVGNLSQLLGTNAAYVGFTGADGGASSVQTVSNFSFVSLPSITISSSGTGIFLLWPDGAPGYTLQQNSDLTTANWSTVAAQPLFTNGQNQLPVTKNGSNLFYRLILPSP